MEKFGFTISRGRQIDYNANDRSIAEFIGTREPSFRLCIECGGCSATCSTGNLTRFSLREIHILIRRGENATVYNALTKCMLCGKCTLVCPRGVNTRNVIIQARKAYQKLYENAV